MYISHFKDDEIQSVLEHNLNVAKKCSLFAKKIDFKYTGFLLGYLHDIGKYSDNFQEYMTNVMEHTKKGDIDIFLKSCKTVDHGKVGAMYLFEKYHNEEIFKEEANPYQQYLIDICCMCIAYHHGGLEDFIDPKNLESPLINRIVDFNKDDDYITAIEKFNKENRIDIENVVNKSLKEFENFWLKYIKPYKSLNYLYFLIIYLYSCLIDADRTDTSDFCNFKIDTKKDSFEKLKTKLDIYHLKMMKNSKKTHINSLRNEIYVNCIKEALSPTGIYTLTVPTGGGKTISSLAFAINHSIKNNLDRVIYNIPFTSIIEQNAEVFRKILGEENVLEFHSNLTNEVKNDFNKIYFDNCGKEEFFDYFKIFSENYDANCIVTTFVQFFNSAFTTGTRNVRKFHNLGNSVIIFDEIQSLNINCIGIFGCLCNFLKDVCHTSIILCSATQPAFQNIDYKEDSLNKFKIKIDKEIISKPEYFYEEFKRTEVINMPKAGGWTIEEIANLGETWKEDYGSVLIVTNTKKEAEKIFDNIKTPNKFLLSTNLCAKHRKDTLEKIKNGLAKKEKLICVSTQLIEAGVDISFGSAIRVIAGAASIGQTAGRVNRNGEIVGVLGKVAVVNIKNEELGSLKDIKIGQDAVRSIYSLNPKSDLLGLNTIEKYFNYYHSTETSVDIERFFLKLINVPNIYKKNICKHMGFDKNFRDDYQKNSSLDNCNKVVIPYIFRTINENFNYIDNNQVTVIVPYKEGKNLISELLSDKDNYYKYSLLKKCQQFSINIFFEKFNELYKDGYIKEVDSMPNIFILNESFYDSLKGLTEDAKLESFIL